MCRQTFVWHRAHERRTEAGWRAAECMYLYFKVSQTGDSSFQYFPDVLSANKSSQSCVVSTRWTAGNVSVSECCVNGFFFFFFSSFALLSIFICSCELADPLSVRQTAAWLPHTFTFLRTQQRYVDRTTTCWRPLPHGGHHHCSNSVA